MLPIMDNAVVKLTRYAIPTANSFQPLIINDAGNKPIVNEVNKKLNPITITDRAFDCDVVLKALNITFNYKLIGIGRKIYIETTDDKAKLEKELISRGIEYFTHPDVTEKTFKVVLSGLPNIPIEEIQESLASVNNLRPSKIIPMGETNKLYLLHFNKQAVSMKDLKNIKAVYNHIIKWLPYKPKRRGPTQCFKCSMYGHGASHCHRQDVCMQCGDAHLTSVCPLNNTNTPDQTKIYKCFNCARRNLQHNHRANDRNCPFRDSYLEIRNTINHKNGPRKLTPKQTQQSQPRTMVTVHSATAPTPPPLQHSFADAVTNKFDSRPPLSQRTASAGERPNVNASENDLFTFEEVSEMLFDSISELSQCKTKLDPLKVVAKLLRKCLP